VSRVRRGTRLGAFLVLWAAAGCGDLDVVTASYATIQEAAAAGAVERGVVPAGLPPSTRDIREAHDRQSTRRWGLFEFSPAEADVLRATLGSEIRFDGLRVTPPRRIEWWPLLLRGDLDAAQLTATGLQAYEAEDGELVVAVNWKQGRAYYWARQRP